MAEESRFYWIKLRTDFFNQKTIDFLLSQKNGCEYVVLYQMLCLQTANNDGELSTKIGEIIMPYDVDKIVRDTKYFDFDTVTIALGLFKQLGLVYESDDNGILKISSFSSMVGSESGSKSAITKRNYRNRQREKIDKKVDNMMDKEVDKMSDRDKSIEYRDKSIEYRDKEKEVYMGTKVPKTANRFIKPTLDEVKAYCDERQNGIDAERFFDYYEANGWVQSKGKPIKDWKATVRTWEKNDYNRKPQEQQTGDGIKWQ